ncbi:ribonuclease H-like domain-containing protein [Tanacetum coccineum]
MVKDFHLYEYNKGMETRKWSEDDKRRSKDFITAIEKRLQIRRIYRSLESFVGGRIRDIDYRLINRTTETMVFHNEDGNPARANIKQALGYLKDGDGNSQCQCFRKPDGSMYFFTSAQDGDPSQDDVRFMLIGTNDLKKAQDHSQRQASDNGTEFKNRDMLEIYGNKGVKQEYSNARTPQQNGVAERMNRTLIEAARTMLADSLLPTTFWAEVYF